jgi:hypothetical protein
MLGFWCPDLLHYRDAHAFAPFLRPCRCNLLTYVTQIAPIRYSHTSVFVSHVPVMYLRVQMCRERWSMDCVLRRQAFSSLQR